MGTLFDELIKKLEERMYKAIMINIHSKGIIVRNYVVLENLSINENSISITSEDGSEYSFLDIHEIGRDFEEPGQNFESFMLKVKNNDAEIFIDLI